MTRIATRCAMVLAIGLATLAVPSAASAQAIPDASCPGPTNLSQEVPGQFRFAQTFTAQNTGLLLVAQIGEVNEAGTPGDYLISINEVDASGFPTNAVLASSTVPDASVPPGLSTITTEFAAPAAVTAGREYAVVITRPGSSLLRLRYSDENPCPGRFYYSPSQSDPFSTACGPSTSCDLVFAVFVEPFDLNAPNATITKAPRNKTRKKRATFEFAGTDARAVAGFQCSIDGGAFTTCTSPYTVKVKKGRHTFQVRAVDQAGNVGTPATDDWKRKKKRKK